MRAPEMIRSHISLLKAALTRIAVENIGFLGIVDSHYKGRRFQIVYIESYSTIEGFQMIRDGL